MFRFRRRRQFLLASTLKPHPALFLLWFWATPKKWVVHLRLLSIYSKYGRLNPTEKYRLVQIGHHPPFAHIT